MNTFGRALRLTTWGESHGVAIGGVLDGIPSGISISIPQIQEELHRRRPGGSLLTSSRQERDTIEILSGLYQGQTTGAPISLLIRNHDARSQDYQPLQETFRPGHADYTYHHKYPHRDPRGGGRSSARETAIRVAAGAIVKQWLIEQGISVMAFASQVGEVILPQDQYPTELIKRSQAHPLGLPEGEVSTAMQAQIKQARSEGDSIGGVITCIAQGVPIGLGEPIYDKLSARLASAMFSINAVRGFELGDGFALASQRASQANDILQLRAGKPYFVSNRSGGILGGISTGADLEMRIAFKPTPTIAQAQQTINTQGEAITLEGKGRHDPCVIPRAIPVVEAMCALVIGDFILLSQSPNK